jgi:sulfur-oxidizing protein SoxB
MTGADIKNVLEDVCDNLFNADPYLQQGGDMVRVGGLSYRCTPGGAIGQRITDLTRDNGKPLAAHKRYKVAGWASMNPQPGKPVWDVVASHLRARGAATAAAHDVVLSGVDGNPGIAEPS